MSKLTDALTSGGTIVENTVYIEGFKCDVLFREPSEAQAIKIGKNLVFESSRINSDGDVRPSMDMNKSDLIKYRASLIAYTAYDPESGVKLFSSENDCIAKLFNAQKEGRPMWSRSVITELSDAAQEVYNANVKN